MTVALHDVLHAAVCLACTAAGTDTAWIRPEPHRPAHLGNVLLLFHDVDDVIRSVRIHLAAVRLGQTEDVPGELDHHHLHSQAYTETRNIILTGISRSDYLTFDAALSEAGTDNHARHSGELSAYVLRRNTLAVDEVDPDFHIIIDTCQAQALAYALVGILQIIFTNKGDLHLPGCSLLFIQEIVPGFHCRCLADRDADLPHDRGIESLALHIHRNFVNTWHILALDDALQVDIAEGCHLHAQCVVEMASGTEDQDVGLDPHSLQFLDTVLRRLCLQLSSRLQVWHICQVYANGVTA